MKKFEELEFDTNEAAALGARAELLNTNRELQQHELDADNVVLGYWLGIRSGIKAFVDELERTAERVGDSKLPVEFVKIISANTLIDAELQLSKMKHGSEIINVIDNNHNQ